MGGVGKKMPKIFAMFTTCSLASLALPGMSGFVAELMVFVGFATSDAYTFNFKLIAVILMADWRHADAHLPADHAAGDLSTVQRIKELVEHEVFIDAEPREVFIIACLLVPIIGFGFYPKLLTQIYDTTTLTLTDTLRTRAFATTEKVQPLAFLPGMQAPALPND
jgi:NAD(P)H-quinone oxidoreductase subunit 4